MTCFSLDELSRMAGEEQAAKEKRKVAPDRFKRPRTEPGRAVPNHGVNVKLRRQASLGGKHS